MAPPLLIECLFVPGCASRDQTLALAEATAAALRLDFEIREITITTPQEAVEQRFLGSPSIRVNGNDIEPGVDLRTDFGMG